VNFLYRKRDISYFDTICLTLWLTLVSKPLTEYIGYFGTFFIVMALFVIQGMISDHFMKKVGE
jgi:hypothetical protein